ncbi:unnamed protein product [Cercopithifilaria johnstoni]|uniref:EGF-like domain-containing protein n=1 Tax=Cercopithifilaria johnstoni TaxID=2874296 RepID=A0A8J2MLK3_9BILA|nr:unnamed protein product [Cercopithifilaria johnstoni]
MIILQIFSTIIIVVNAENPDNNSITESTKVDYNSLWLPRTFRIICCLNGYPVPQNPEIIRNWTHEESDYIIDESYNEHSISSSVGSLKAGAINEKLISKCRIYRGSYLLSAPSMFTFDAFTGIGIVCKCPEMPGNEYLDRNCRRLKPCLNNGHHRPFDSNSHCICPEPYFGEQCEKYCDQGQRMTGADGRDYCACTPFYQGEECQNIVCLNGGTKIRRQCLCPPNLLGYHCEIDANHTSVMLRFHGYREQGVYQNNDLLTRDISSTIFSLVMIAVLILSMYLLMKHRMQVQNRFAAVRREALVRSGIEINSHLNNIIVPEDPRVLSFRTITFPNEGPPPYVINSQRGRYQADNLPTLPTYEDATKLPPFRPQMEEEIVIGEEEQVIQSDVTLLNELQITERMTEVGTNDDESSAVRPSLQHSPERATSVLSGTSIYMHISTTDNNSMFSKKSLIRKSI